MLDRRAVKFSVDATAKHMYLINCLAAIQQVMAGGQCCHSRHAILQQAVQQHINDLVQNAVCQLLTQSSFHAQVTQDRWVCLLRLPVAMDFRAAFAARS